MNNYFCKLLLCSFLLVLVFSCQPAHDKEENSDFIRIVEEPSYIQQDTFFERLFHRVVFLQDYKSVESLITSKIQEETIARNTKNVKILYADFFLLPYLFVYSANSDRFSKEAEDVLFTPGDFSTDWNLTYALYNYHREIKNSSKSMEFASRLVELSSKILSQETKALADMAIGEAYDLNGNYKLAISNLFNALSGISHSQRKDVQIHILSSLSRFYEGHYMFKNALDYKIQEMELRNPKTRLDSIMYFHVVLQYHDLINITNNNQVFEMEKILEIIEFSKQNKCQRLYEFATAFLRTTLLSTNRTKEIKAYFNSLEKDEIDKLEAQSPYVIYLFSAYFMEEDGSIVKAKNFYEKALWSLENKPGQDNRKSFIHLQYAKFLTRNGYVNDAEKHFVKAVEFARTAKNDAFEIDASKAAEEFFFKNKNYENAHYFLNNYHKLLEAKSITSKDQDVFKIEIETEQKILEENKKLEGQFQEKLHQGQYNLIAIFCISLMMFLLISVRFKVPVWFIRVVGYMGVIFIFEFSMIQIDSVVHEVTHHTPWKIFTIKVLLISILLPLHHLVEKRLIKFLISRRQAEGNLVSFNVDFIKKWFKKLDEPDDGH